MTNQSTFDMLLAFFRKIRTLSQTIYIFDNGSLRVSLLDFWVALALMSIVLFALVNFVRTRSGLIADRYSDIKSHGSNVRRENTYKEYKGDKPYL